MNSRIILEIVIIICYSYTGYRRITHLSYDVDKMAVRYKKLWKLLIDKDIKKLQREAGTSSTSIGKFCKSENVNTEILEKICFVLHCNVI